MTTYTATYSPEDNKLRLYASSHLDSETYQMINKAGFKWAPKQELFVTPSWSPDREDILIDLAGEIEPEEMTLAERAEAKAARIDDAIEKKRLETDSYYRAASSISERFASGQPILLGHHSERKARKDSERMGRAMNNASAAMEKIRYLAWKAEGVERLSTYFRKEKHEVSIVEMELRFENEKLKAIIEEKEKAQAQIEQLYQEKLKLEIEKSRQTFLLETQTKDERISELESENQKLKEVEELYNKNIEEIENYKKKEEEYNSKSFFYRLTHKF